jgi:hypothetical protein
MNSKPGNKSLLKGLIWAYFMIMGLSSIFSVNKLQAHEGPPFPIIVDEQVGPYLVSVWTDPDIGIGTFFVILEPVSGDDLPEIRTVQVAVEPTSGRLEEAVYTAELQRVRYGARYYTEVEFDQGEMWKVRINIVGLGWGGELFSEVEATPDGSIGPIGLVVYALPFVGIGILWFRAFFIRRRQE